MLKEWQKCVQENTSAETNMAGSCSGEYLSRNKRGGIMPCAIAYNMSNPIQYFLTYLEKDRALEKASQAHGNMEKRLLKDYL